MSPPQDAALAVTPPPEPAHAAFGESQLQFRQLLDKLPAGAYTCDPAGLITYFNPHAVRIWGRLPALNDPIDRFCGSFKLYAADGAPIAHDQCWMALALRDGKEYNGEEILIERPDGSRVSALAHANPIRDASGGLLGAVNVLVDITERKRAEAALHTDSRRKDEFIATLAHELRNPLSPLLHSLQILRIKPSGTRTAEMALDVADRQLKQLTRLIDDLLDISRIAHDKLELRRAPVDLGDVLRVAVEINHPSIEAKRHEFTLTLPDDPIIVDADALRLTQAVSNLLNNAAKYTRPEGRIWMVADREGDQAVITVRDNGAGMTADVLACVFDMFAQGTNAPARPNAGLGIGLALTRRLVEMHGGIVTAHSEGKDCGSAFAVRLPITSATAAIDAGAAAAPSINHAELALRIVVVDDNEDAVEALRTLLDMAGNDVRCAYDGEEAFMLAETFHPDVMFLDIGLPKLDGWTLAERLRDQPWGKLMLLVAVSGWGQRSDLQRSKEAGFDRHLVKPADQAQILQLLAAYKHGLRPSVAEGARAA